MLFVAKMRLAAMVTAAILLLTGAGAATQPAPDQPAPGPGGAAPAPNPQPNSQTPKPAPESKRVQVSDILWGAQTDATGHAKAVQMLGHNGFAVIRSAAEEKVFMDRLEQTEARRGDHSVRLGYPLDSTTHYGWGRMSFLYGCGATCTACWTSR